MRLKINPDVRFQPNATGHPDSVLIKDVLQDFQDHDRRKLTKQYGKEAEKLHMWLRPQAYIDWHYVKSHGDNAVYLAGRPEKMREQRTRDMMRTHPGLLKEIPSGEGGCFSSSNVWFFLRVINQTPDPETGLYRVHWLRIPPLADHAPNIAGVAWTYDCDRTTYGRLTLDNRS